MGTSTGQHCPMGSIPQNSHAVPLTDSLHAVGGISIKGGERQPDLPLPNMEIQRKKSKQNNKHESPAQASEK